MMIIAQETRVFITSHLMSYTYKVAGSCPEKHFQRQPPPQMVNMDLNIGVSPRFGGFIKRSKSTTLIPGTSLMFPGFLGLCHPPKEGPTLFWLKVSFEAQQYADTVGLNEWDRLMGSMSSIRRCHPAGNMWFPKICKME